MGKARGVRRAGTQASLDLQNTSIDVTLTLADPRTLRDYAVSL